MSAAKGPPLAAPIHGGKGDDDKVHGDARTKSSYAALGEQGAHILALLRRPKGARLAEMRKASGWQAHSVRGFLSTAAKRYSLRIESLKSEGNERVYQIK